MVENTMFLFTQGQRLDLNYRPEFSLLIGQPATRGCSCLFVCLSSVTFTLRSSEQTANVIQVTPVRFHFARKTESDRSLTEPRGSERN